MLSLIKLPISFIVNVNASHRPLLDVVIFMMYVSSHIELLL